MEIPTSVDELKNLAMLDDKAPSQLRVVLVSEEPLKGSPIGETCLTHAMYWDDMLLMSQKSWVCTNYPDELHRVYPAPMHGNEFVVEETSPLYAAWHAAEQQNPRAGGLKGVLNPPRHYVFARVAFVMLMGRQVAPDVPKAGGFFRDGRDDESR